MSISWMLTMPSFKKSLIVEQFQGNYLNLSTHLSSKRIVHAYILFRLLIVILFNIIESEDSYEDSVESIHYLKS